jgi:hypothetical protein
LKLGLQRWSDSALKVATELQGHSLILVAQRLSLAVTKD